MFASTSYASSIIAAATNRGAEFFYETLSGRRTSTHELIVLKHDRTGDLQVAVTRCTEFSPVMLMMFMDMVVEYHMLDCVVEGRTMKSSSDNNCTMSDRAIAFNLKGAEERCEWTIVSVHDLRENVEYIIDMAGVLADIESEKKEAEEVKSEQKTIQVQQAEAPQEPIVAIRPITKRTVSRRKKVAVAA